MPAALQTFSSHWLHLCVLITLLCSTLSVVLASDSGLAKRKEALDPVVNIQVQVPVLTPKGSSDEHGCIHTQTLMDHTFAFSYGVPFKGKYTPPPCSFNRVTMNFTVASQGTQFDRLGIMYLGGVEVFRTSTAEPTSKGIVWTYVKDMTQYNALWTKEQDLLFALPNVIDKKYNGTLISNLTATFFTVPDSARTADQILPITSKRNDYYGNAFRIPDETPSQVSLQLPRNIERAVVSLSACGQGSEEFWYTNVFDGDTQTFKGQTLPGSSPYREVQLFIDGQLAGLTSPFPVIFTGGINPAFWRPIAGIDAFDLRQREIDVTPWLGLLCDGASHTFEVRVAGMDDNRNLKPTVGGFWLVTGTVFVFLDKAGSVTKGSYPQRYDPGPRVDAPHSTVTKGPDGSNQELIYSTKLQRNFAVVNQVTTSSGSREVSWIQNLTYSNFNHISQGGFYTYTTQNISGTDKTADYSTNYSFPLSSNFSYTVFPDGKPKTIQGNLSQGLDLQIIGQAVFPSGLNSFNLSSASAFTPADPGLLLTIPAKGALYSNTSSTSFIGSSLSTALNSSTHYTLDGCTSKGVGYGFTEQSFSFGGLTRSAPSSPKELYSRHVKAINGTLVTDDQTFAGQNLPVPHRQLLEATDPPMSFDMQNLGDVTPHQFLGRTGPSGGDDAAAAAAGLHLPLSGTGLQSPNTTDPSRAGPKLAIRGGDCLA